MLPLNAPWWAGFGFLGPLFLLSLSPQDFKHNTPFLNWKEIIKVREWAALLILGSWEFQLLGWQLADFCSQFLPLPAEGGACLPSTALALCNPQQRWGGSKKL